MEHFETAAYAHARLRENIEDSLLKLAGCIKQFSQIEEQVTWDQVADMRKLDALLEEALLHIRNSF